MPELKRENIIGKKFERTMTLDTRALNVNDEERTVELSFSSSQPVYHWFGYLKLDHSKSSIRLERLETTGALLWAHDSRQQIGAVESVKLATKEGVCRATVKFSDSAQGDENFRDVKNSIKRSVSFGFLIYEIEPEVGSDGEQMRADDGELVYICRDWEPFEISLVSIPADISVGVGRSFERDGGETCAECGDGLCPECGGCVDCETCTCAMGKKRRLKISKQKAHDLRENSTTTEKTMAKDNENPATDTNEEQRTQPVPAVPNAEVTRIADFGAYGDAFQEGDFAREYAVTNPAATLQELGRAILAKRQANQTDVPPSAPQTVAERNGGQIELARSIPRYGSLRSFKGDNAAQRAHRFGMWFLAGPVGLSGARDWCKTNGVLLRTQNEGQNEKGGFLVPEEFGNEMIDLREMFGVFRRNAKVVPMMSDTRSDPRRTGGLTAYFTAESAALTASDKFWDRVELVAKKLTALARISSELSEDASISIADDLAYEMAYAFANKEDECGFNGDGSSTYGEITGVRDKLKGLSGTIANISGLLVGSGNAYSELTLADFEGVVALLPQYADTPSAKWFVHRSFYYNVMVKLLLAAGGVTAAEIEGMRTKSFLGYAVEFAQVLPKTEANSQVCALLGDLSLAANLGDRRQIRIETSEHSRFANDEMEIKGTERVDINVHSVGNATATAADKAPGPVVGLITAAS